MNKLDPERCKESICSPGIWHSHQCQNKAKKDGYCGIHHPDAVKARQDKSDKMHDEKHQRSPWMRLQKMSVKLKETEECLARAMLWVYSSPVENENRAILIKQFEELTEKNTNQLP